MADRANRSALESGPRRKVKLAANPLAQERKSKFSIGDLTHVNDNVPADFRKRTGIITEIGPGKAEYRVEFEDGERPTTGYLLSSWLDRG